MVGEFLPNHDPIDKEILRKILGVDDEIEGSSSSDDENKRTDSQGYNLNKLNPLN